MFKKNLLYGLSFVFLVGLAVYVGYRIKIGPANDFAPVPKSGGILGRPLRVAIVSWPGYAGGIVANNGFAPNHDCVYWSNHNLEVEFELIEDNDAINKAFANRSVDIVWNTVDSLANQLPNFRDGGIGAKAVLQVDWSRGGDAIVATNNIQKITDLKGKRVALALLTPSQFFFETKLKSAPGLTDADRTAIENAVVGKNGSPEARTDFVAGRVDAAVIWEPDVAEALKGRPGSHVLASTLRDPNLLSDVMVARTDFIEEHPDAVQAFVSGWIEGTTLAERDHGSVAKLLMSNEPAYKALGYAETFRELDEVKWADKQDNTAMFGLDGQSPLFDQIYSQAWQTWHHLGMVNSSVDPADAKDVAFIRKAVEER
jgi:NitT/TauT family transport system substrate-binding protein